jgi:membrane associated rhomboid family serine protease
MTSADNDLLNFSAHARVLLSLTAIAWIIHAININGWLSRIFCLRPRHLWGLIGIPLSPLLHADSKHLTGNTGAFLPLAWFVMLQGIHLFYVVTLSTVIGSGLLTWLFGRERGQYIGASDLIFGYLGFLLIYGITAANSIALLLGLTATYLYGKMITGYNVQFKGKEIKIASSILPNSDESIAAWESHLFGFMIGGLMAYTLSSMRIS